jgi:hypothetical protein
MSCASPGIIGAEEANSICGQDLPSPKQKPVKVSRWVRSAKSSLERPRIGGSLERSRNTGGTTPIVPSFCGVDDYGDTSRVNGATYACRKTRTPTRQASAMLCQKT